MIFMKKITTRLLSLVLLGAFIPSFVLADTWYLDKGDITVNATGTIQTVTQGAAPVEDPNPVITSNGKTENTVIINAGENATANVTLENVNIDVSSNSEAAITTQGQGDVTLNLSGNNSVQSGTYHAGVHKENAGNLTVTTPEGALMVTATISPSPAVLSSPKAANTVPVSAAAVTAATTMPAKLQFPAAMSQPPVPEALLESAAATAEAARILRSQAE